MGGLGVALIRAVAARRGCELMTTLRSRLRVRRAGKESVGACSSWLSCGENVCGYLQVDSIPGLSVASEAEDDAHGRSAAMHRLGRRIFERANPLRPSGSGIGCCRETECYWSSPWQSRPDDALVADGSRSPSDYSSDSSSRIQVRPETAEGSPIVLTAKATTWPISSCVISESRH